MINLQSEYIPSKLTIISTGVFVPDETIGCEKDISSNWPISILISPPSYKF